MNIIFPDRCPCCLKLQKSQEICEECKGFVRFITGDICKKCGKQKEICVCKKEKSKYDFDGVIATFYYESSVRYMIHNLKFYGCESAGRYMLKHMKDTFNRYLDANDYDYILPVPDFPASKRYKGFSHTEYLCKKLSKFSRIKYTNELKKVVDNRKQHLLSNIARSGNTAGVYDVSKNIFENKRVLLIDDVFTTGNTANECARMLKIYGAKSVTVFVAALAPPKNNSSFEYLQ